MTEVHVGDKLKHRLPTQSPPGFIRKSTSTCWDVSPVMHLLAAESGAALNLLPGASDEPLIVSQELPEACSMCAAFQAGETLFFPCPGPDANFQEGGWHAFFPCPRPGCKFSGIGECSFFPCCRGYFLLWHCLALQQYHNDVWIRTSTVAHQFCCPISCNNRILNICKFVIMEAFLEHT